MKDITRIHIAKVPYNVELSAKKQLEKYTSELEAFTADAELLQDIEIRITELLLERGVKQDDVISEADVASIREQLGEPKEFLADDTATDVDVSELSGESSRTLYRNLDTAILGGVLGGISSYFKINPVWIRLAFIALLFVSFGLAALLYVVAWLIIPPARSSAEKLRMSGRQVTLSSIRELNEVTGGRDVEQRTAIVRRVLTTLLGLGAIGGALASMAALAVVGIQLGTGTDIESGWALDYQLPLILMFVSGALLTVLCLLIAVAAFTQKFNKRIWVSGIIIIALGLTTFGAGVVTATYQQRVESEEIRRNTIESSLTLPVDFNAITTLTVDMKSATNVTYIVDSKAPSMMQRMMKGSKPVTVTVENGVAKLSLDESTKATYANDEQVIIHGPRLEKLIVTNGSVSYEGDAQEKLIVEARNASSVWLGESRINALVTTLDGTANLSADSATIVGVDLSLYGRSAASLGHIKTLSVKSPGACATDAAAELTVQGISSPSYDYNGTEAASRSSKEPCFVMKVESDDDDSYRY